MGAAKTFLIKNATAASSNFGSLQDGGSLTTATTTTIWNNGIVPGGNYAPMMYNATSSGWGASPALPQSVLNNTAGNADAWRTETTYNGVFIPGTWSFSTSLIATSASTGSGRLTFRLYRGSDPTGASAVQLTSGIVSTTTWSNLTTSVAQTLTATVSLSTITLSNEYLFWQMAMLTVTANGSVSAAQAIRVDSTNSKLVTPAFSLGLAGNGLTTTVSYAGRQYLKVAQAAQGLLDSTPPTFAGLQSVGSATPSSLTLSWNAASDMGTAQSKITYDIYQATSSGAQVYSSPSYSTSQGATSYTVTGLDQVTTYYFVVRARDLAGNSDTNAVELSGTTDATSVTYVF